MTAFTESVVEQAALAWLESIGWTVRHGAEIAPGELAAERADDSQVVLQQRDCAIRSRGSTPASPLRRSKMPSPR